ncbi:5'-nucleotidase [Rhabdobacter roseus]|uniref:5'-nucleotidase n=1 Tax=Rhabdobacter roseus TaxID=1655419 RepID=A0A840TG37_9BACT|nr:bifunctional metallophosphatase/5'-nucleotidase [Rhabdobacter roseus]MBB5281905.1 5'-nucleotidase [Rhabdobacter roseus]
MKQTRSFLLIVTVALLSACQSSRTITFLHINDVYEIAPLDNGRAGGMARVAYLNQKLKKKNPAGTYFVHAGDFLSPSVIGTLQHEGQRIRGRQMVEVMNAAGVDYVTFGNHEFDYDEQVPTVLTQRLEESRFQWVIANMKQRQGTSAVPFRKDGAELPSSVILSNGKIRVGLFGVCLPVSKDFLEVTDFIEAARREYQDLQGRCDVVVALTHLDVADDKRLAEQLPGLALIMGGHDHDHLHEQVGKVPIYKADANAKTVYVHRLRFNRRKQWRRTQSELVTIDAAVPEEPRTAAVVDKWQQIAAQSFRELGFAPNEVVYTTQVPWDGREKTVRTEHLALTDALAQSIFEAFPDSDLALFNGGSVRVDDVLEGTITQYDLIRILPFGGGTSQVTMTGDLLHQVLEAGRLSRGKGAFLHLHQARYDEPTQTWYLANQPLDRQSTYKVALPDFLMTGKEFGMGFLLPTHPGVKALFSPEPTDYRTDIRKVFMAFLKKQG